MKFLLEAPRNRGFPFLGTKMNQQTTSTTGSNGESSLHDLFALTDEQILEIEPEGEALPSQPNGTASAVISGEARNPSSSETADEAARSKSDSSSPSAPRNDGAEASSRNLALTSNDAEPPPWLAAQMKDPWTGEEARELWNGVQQAKSEAAAYRAAFANPEDARALKELYPGGVNEARAAAERARVLDDIDRAYFGAPGKSAQEVSASRAQLAQTMLREDPAAFREMVFAGLRALEDLGKGTSENTLAQALRPESVSSSVSAAATDRKSLTPEGVSYSDQHAAALAAYASFEKATNDDLERSVGATIERTLHQALPNASRVSNASGVGAQAAPLQARLTAAIRQDVEAALKGDRQLSEQVAQILSGRRLDNETRAQVVRLIGERAQQLVPVAAKRVLNDWTQTTLAAHRGNVTRADAASSRSNIAADVAQGLRPEEVRRSRQTMEESAGLKVRAIASDRCVDYRKLSDEQILEM